MINRRPFLSLSLSLSLSNNCYILVALDGKFILFDIIKVMFE